VFILLLVLKFVSCNYWKIH